MVNLNVYTSHSNSRPIDRSVSPPGPPRVPSAEASAAAEGGGTDSTVSILARQLNEAATRADAREAGLDRGDLDKVTGEGYFASKIWRDAELPDTNEPLLLERARQATGFLNGSESNPFKALARDQLSLIVHDDSGSFTLNERRAAWEEANPDWLSEIQRGQGLMITRLFRGHEPPVAQPPLTRDNIGQGAVDFLTRGDRELLSQIYAYAQAEGADLAYVDNVAGLLGDYRHHSDGRQMLSANSGKGYNTEGYMVTVNFKEGDAAIAARILNGSAINSTRLDQGFLRYVLDPGYGAMSNTGGMNFLEQIVIKFSNESSTQAPLGGDYVRYPSINITDNIVITVHKDVKLPPFEPHAATVNGVVSLSEKGETAGYIIDKKTGRVVLLAPSPTIPATVPLRQARYRSLLDFIDGAQGARAIRPKWLSSLFQVLRNDRF